MIVAVVLAAGESSRMGRPKALLPIEGQTFIEKIVGALKQSTIGKVIIVLGHNSEEIRARIAHLPAEILVNSNYKSGQLSSLQTAVRRLESEADCDALLVHLVDHPYIDPALVDEMIRRFYQSKKLIVVPCRQERRGHPVIFARELFAELLDAPLDQGAKAVVNAHRDETLEIETDQEGIAVDIDTPDLYRRHVKGE